MKWPRILQKLLALCTLVLLTAFYSSIVAQTVVEVPGWTYHRYGEEIGLLGNRYILYTPFNYNANQRYRVILHSHGAGGNPESDAAALLICPL
jgi:hypothetical protein